MFKPRGFIYPTSRTAEPEGPGKFSLWNVRSDIQQDSRYLQWTWTQNEYDVEKPPD